MNPNRYNMSKDSSSVPIQVLTLVALYPDLYRQFRHSNPFDIPNVYVRYLLVITYIRSYYGTCHVKHICALFKVKNRKGLLYRLSNICLSGLVGREADTLHCKHTGRKPYTYYITPKGQEVIDYFFSSISLLEDNFTQRVKDYKR